ncbi:MAG: glycine zipper family protein [Bacteriovorax sp.]
MNSLSSRNVFSFLALMIFWGCSSTTPSGPKVAVMPAPGKPFEVFVAEDQLCREYAMQSIGKAPKTASGNAVATTIAGTALGTAAGALMGGHQGAATGAGVGMVVGAAGGASQAGYEGHDIQWSYDIAYSQCMYAKGNQVPGYQMQQATPPKEEHKK